MNTDVKDVPYIVHEGAMARAERTVKRLWISTILLLIALIATNAAWIWYESQWEVVEEVTTTQSVTQSADSKEGDAINRFVGGDEYGETKVEGTEE